MGAAIFQGSLHRQRLKDSSIHQIMAPVAAGRTHNLRYIGRRLEALHQVMSPIKVVQYFTAQRGQAAGNHLEGERAVQDGLPVQRDDLCEGVPAQFLVPQAFHQCQSNQTNAKLYAQAKVGLTCICKKINKLNNSQTKPVQFTLCMTSSSKKSRFMTGALVFPQ